MGSQAPLGSKPLWKTAGVHLPGYIREIARSIRDKRGMPLGKAIQLAIGVVRNWAEGKGEVKPETRAKAAKAVAEFEAMRAKAKAAPNNTAHHATRRALTLATTTGQEATMGNPCPTCGVGVTTSRDGGLALAMPPALAKAQKAGKTGAKKTPKGGTSNSGPATKTTDAAKSSVQVPAGQEAQFKALVARIKKRPGQTQQTAEKAAAAILRNRKASGKPTAKAS